MNFQASELILNNNGSIYHLDLLPEHLADTIITVGDPDRVEMITRHFNKIEIKRQKREFHTQTGYYKGKRISVISTGIGPDNIDIVINELDALANIDFETRQPKEIPRQLEFIRIGTSGSIQEEIPVDSILISEMAIGLDGLLHFYDSREILDAEVEQAFVDHLGWYYKKARPYAVAGDLSLIEKMNRTGIFLGTTATTIGFYAPQGRSLRLGQQDEKMNNKLATFSYLNKKITNLEMETSALYGLAKLLGHKAISMNAVLANRVTGEFSSNPIQLVDLLIEYTLRKLVE